MWNCVEVGFESLGRGFAFGEREEGGLGLLGTGMTDTLLFCFVLLLGTGGSLIKKERKKDMDTQ
jgi:hypothetical protein